MGHDIVLDLHCDDEGVAYLYVPAALWPAMEDCAAAMGVEAVILWEGSSGAVLRRGVAAPVSASCRPRQAGSPSRVVTTVEYRGLPDVDRAYAEADAEGTLPAARRARRCRGRRNGCDAEAIRRPRRADRAMSR